MSTAPVRVQGSSARYIARQPVFDARQHVVGYELLFRGGEHELAATGSPEDMSRRVIADAFSLFGIQSLTHGKPAFLNFTRSALLADIASLLPPDHVIIELLETVTPDEEVVRACRNLKAHGFRIALDDFEWSESWAPVLELADIVKSDFRATLGDERRVLVRRLRRFGVTLLAEKVETRAEFEAAAQAGYEWFQGYFFARPATVTGRDLRGHRHHYEQILQLVSAPSCDLRAVEEAVKRDVSLSYKLLRVVNSASLSRQRRVDSIHQALALLGLDEVRKWVALLTLAGLSEGKPAELVRTALVRARFCEAIAGTFGAGERSTDLFLVGLFSLLDALVDRPMKSVLAEMPLSEDVAAAVRGCTGPLGGPLECAIAWERGAWEKLDAVLAPTSARSDELLDAWARAVAWADECGETMRGR